MISPSEVQVLVHRTLTTSKNFESDEDGNYVKSSGTEWNKKETLEQE